MILRGFHRAANNRFQLIAKSSRLIDCTIRSRENFLGEAQIFVFEAVGFGDAATFEFKCEFLFPDRVARHREIIFELLHERGEPSVFRVQPLPCDDVLLHFRRQQFLRLCWWRRRSHGRRSRRWRRHGVLVLCVTAFLSWNDAHGLSPFHSTKRKPFLPLSISQPSRRSLIRAGAT